LQVDASAMIAAGILPHFFVPAVFRPYGKRYGGCVDCVKFYQVLKPCLKSQKIMVTLCCAYWPRWPLQQIDVLSTGGKYRRR
jgi:hypothetical protein